MTKADILKVFQEKYPDLQRKVLKEMVDLFFETLVETIKKGERIEIRGFGVFETINRNPRICINPKTSEQVKVKGYKTVKFKPSKLIKKLP